MAPNGRETLEHYSTERLSLPEIRNQPKNAINRPENGTERKRNAFALLDRTDTTPKDTQPTKICAINGHENGTERKRKAC